MDDMLQNNEAQQVLSKNREQCEAAKRIIERDILDYAMSFCNRPVPTNAIKIALKPLSIHEKYWNEAFKIVGVLF